VVRRATCHLFSSSADHGSKYFKEKSLIYVPFTKDDEGDPEKGAWYSLNQCLWEGPKCLRLHVCLKDVYPANLRLFRYVLQIPDASIKHLLLEAVRFKKRDDLSYIIDIFLEIEKFLGKDITDSRSLQSAREGRIWPISQGILSPDFDDLMSANVSSEWFIADRVALRESFNGIIPLLAFQVNDIGRMERVLKALGVEERRLSIAAKSVPETEGSVEMHQGHTEAFRSKFGFISR
jgi:hypothetical protein